MEGRKLALAERFFCKKSSGGRLLLARLFPKPQFFGDIFYPNKPDDHQQWINRYHAIIIENGVLKLEMVQVHDGTGHATAKTFEVEEQLGRADFNACIVKKVAGQYPQHKRRDEQQAKPNQVFVFFHEEDQWFVNKINRFKHPEADFRGTQANLQ